MGTANEARPGVFYGWIIVAAGCAILLVVWGFQYSYGVFFTELCDDLNWKRTTVSGAYSLFMVWHSVNYFFSGWLNDRYGPRLILAICIITLTGGYALMSAVTAPWQLYGVYGIVIGTGCGFAFLPVTSTVSRWFVKRRGMALGIAVAGIGMGTLALAPFAQFLITRFDWRTSYLLVAGILLIAGLPVSRLMRSDPLEKGLLPYGLEGRREGGECGSSPCAFDFTLRQAIRTKAFWLLFAMFIFFNCAVQMVMVHFKAYATDLGITPMVAATFIGVIGIVSSAGRIIMGHVSDRVGRKACFFISYLLMSMMMMWLLEATQPWQFYFFSVTFGFFYGSCVPLFPAATADWFGTRSQGAILGTLLLAPGIGGAIGPLLAGRVFDSAGSYDVAIVAGAVVLLAGAVCSVLIKAPCVVRSA
ncbi:MAG: MFS transporter [Chloroflexi bacterium]|nr:MFS transporter [Chloroflexota bacterium]